jgi:hypothetical protein
LTILKQKADIRMAPATALNQLATMNKKICSTYLRSSLM